MLSEKQNSSISYLYQVLRDGARPFRYRNGVRSLLGTPDNERIRLLFFSTLPPGGFTYANIQFMEEPNITGYSPFKPDRSALAGEPGMGLDDSQSRVQNIQSRLIPEKELKQDTGDAMDSIHQSNPMLKSRRENLPDDAGEKLANLDIAIEKGSMKIPDLNEKSPYSPILSTPKKNKTVLSQPGEDLIASHRSSGENFIRKPLSEVAPVSESKKEKIQIRTTEKLDSSEIVIEKTSITIPGSSEKSQFFPELSTLKKGKTVSSRADEYIEISPQSSPENIAKKHFFETQEQKSIIQPLKNLKSTSEKLQPSGEIKKGTVAVGSALGLENPLSIKAEADREEIKSTTRNKLYSPKKLSLPVDMNEQREFYPYRTSNVSDYLEADNDAMSTNRNATARIEQLRQALHELTLKRNAPQEKTSDKNQSEQLKQTPPAPAQPVVIIKRFANQTQIPHAFWERSYLSRFHLRTIIR